MGSPLKNHRLFLKSFCLKITVKTVIYMEFRCHSRSKVEVFRTPIICRNTFGKDSLVIFRLVWSVVCSFEGFREETDNRFGVNNRYEPEGFETQYRERSDGTEVPNRPLRQPKNRCTILDQRKSRVVKSGGPGRHYSRSSLFLSTLPFLPFVKLKLCIKIKTVSVLRFVR